VRKDLPATSFPHQTMKTSMEMRTLYEAVRSFKTILDVVTGRLGDPIDSAVTWRDLQTAGVLTEEQVRAIIGNG
jgi:hypothetical protein